MLHGLTIRFGSIVESAAAALGVFMSSHWNRHALMSPAVRRFLDFALKMPGSVGDAVQAVDAVLPDVKAMLLRAAESGMTLGGYDRDAAEAVAHAMAGVMDAKCVGSVPGDEVYERVLSGGMVGLGIGTGGMRAYGRYLKRFGAISRFVAMGLDGVAGGLYSGRAAFNAASHHFRRGRSFFGF